MQRCIKKEKKNFRGKLFIPPLPFRKIMVRPLACTALFTPLVSRLAFFPERNLCGEPLTFLAEHALDGNQVV